MWHAISCSTLGRNLGQCRANSKRCTIAIPREKDLMSLNSYQALLSMLIGVSDDFLTALQFLRITTNVAIGNLLKNRFRYINCEILPYCQSAHKNIIRCLSYFMKMVSNIIRNALH